MYESDDKIFKEYIEEFFNSAGFVAVYEMVVSILSKYKIIISNFKFTFPILMKNQLDYLYQILVSQKIYKYIPGHFARPDLCILSQTKTNDKGEQYKITIQLLTSSYLNFYKGEAKLEKYIDYMIKGKLGNTFPFLYQLDWKNLMKIKNDLYFYYFIIDPKDIIERRSDPVNQSSNNLFREEDDNESNQNETMQRFNELEINNANGGDDLPHPLEDKTNSTQDAQTTRDKTGESSIPNKKQIDDLTEIEKEGILRVICYSLENLENKSYECYEVQFGIIIVHQSNLAFVKHIEKIGFSLYTKDMINDNESSLHFMKLKYSKISKLSKFEVLKFIPIYQNVDLNSLINN